MTSWSNDDFFHLYFIARSLNEKLRLQSCGEAGGLRGQEVATGKTHVTTASLTVELLALHVSDSTPVLCKMLALHNSNALDHTANMLTVITSTSQLAVEASLAIWRLTLKNQ